MEFGDCPRQREKADNLFTLTWLEVSSKLTKKELVGMPAASLLHPATVQGIGTVSNLHSALS